VHHFLLRLSRGYQVRGDKVKIGDDAAASPLQVIIHQEMRQDGAARERPLEVVLFAFPFDFFAFTLFVAWCRSKTL
jgi:hypothetical protein